MAVEKIRDTSRKGEAMSLAREAKELEEHDVNHSVVVGRKRGRKRGQGVTSRAVPQCLDGAVLDTQQ